MLEYLNGIILNNTKLNSRSVVLEAELAQIESMLQERNFEVKLYEEKLQQSDFLITEAQTEMDRIRTQTQNLSQEHDVWMNEKSSVGSQLERSKLEADDLSKIQYTLLMQLRSKDDELENSSAELRVCKARIHELELDQSLMQGQLLAANARITHSEGDRGVLIDKLTTLEMNAASNAAKLSTLTPELIASRIPPLLPRDTTFILLSFLNGVSGT